MALEKLPELTTEEYNTRAMLHGIRELLVQQKLTNQYLAVLCDIIIEPETETHEE